VHRRKSGVEPPFVTNAQGKPQSKGRRRAAGEKRAARIEELAARLGLKDYRYERTGVERRKAQAIVVLKLGHHNMLDGIPTKA